MWLYLTDAHSHITRVAAAIDSCFAFPYGLLMSTARGAPEYGRWLLRGLKAMPWLPQSPSQRPRCCGCYCPNDMVVRMRRVIAIQRGLVVYAFFGQKRDNNTLSHNNLQSKIQKTTTTYNFISSGRFFSDILGSVLILLLFKYLKFIRR